jgi:predicted MPP superfamily phosphohydrolase
LKLYPIPEIRRSYKRDAVSEPPVVEEKPDSEGDVSRRAFLRRTTRGAAALAGGTLLYTWRVEPHWIEVVERPLPIAGLGEALIGKRLIQVSDLHAGPVVDQSYLIGAMHRVAELRPDCLLVTGDFMSCYQDEEVPRALEVIRELPAAPLGRFAILGNHDYGQFWRHEDVADKLSAKLEKLELRVLRNEVADIGGLQLAGVDDLWTRRFDLGKAVSDISTDTPALMLCHNPDGVDRPELAEHRGWTLSGHTHGGQCRAPFFNTPYNPERNERYVAGEYELASGGRLYINRGLGYLARVRFNARPEITVFTLQAA